MNVESFNLDHTKVVAPYVRMADRKELRAGTCSSSTTCASASPTASTCRWTPRTPSNT